jgi:hypothetical protein
MSPSLVIINQESIEGFDGLSLETLHQKEWVPQMLVFQCFGTRDTQGQVSLYFHVANSQLVKPRNGIAWLEFGVSAFQHLGYPRKSFLIFACHEIPKYETPKRSSMDQS